MQARPKRCHLHHPWHSDLHPHLVSCWHLSAIVEGLSRRYAKYCLLCPYPVCRTHYVWLECFWLFMILFFRSCQWRSESQCYHLAYMDTNLNVGIIGGHIQSAYGGTDCGWRRPYVTSSMTSTGAPVWDNRHAIGARLWPTLVERAASSVPDLCWRRQLWRSVIDTFGTLLFAVLLPDTPLRRPNFFNIVVALCMIFS